MVLSVTYKLSLQLDRSSVLCLFGLQPINLRWVINLRRVINRCLFWVIARYTCWGFSAVILLKSTPNTFYYPVLFLVFTKLCLSHKFRTNFIVIFCNTITRCSQVHLRPPESFDLQYKSNIERRVFIRFRKIVVMDIVTLI